MQHRHERPWAVEFVDFLGIISLLVLQDGYERRVRSQHLASLATVFSDATVYSYIFVDYFRLGAISH